MVVIKPTESKEIYKNDAGRINFFEENGLYVIIYITFIHYILQNMSTSFKALNVNVNIIK